jgi:hypothetical protein
MNTSLRMEYDTKKPSHSLVYEEITTAGKSQISMNRQGSKLFVTGSLVSGEKLDIEETLEENEGVSASMTAALIPIVEIANELEVGQTTGLKNKTIVTSPSFQITDEKTIIKREADETKQTPQGMITVKVYTLNVDSGTVPYDSILLLDEDGRLYSLEIKSQMGRIKFTRIE